MFLVVPSVIFMEKNVCLLFVIPYVASVSTHFTL